MASKGDTLQRLTSDIIAGGVAINYIAKVGVWEDRSTWLVDPSSLQAAAQPIINAFDESESAHNAWLNTDARKLAIAAYDNDRTNIWKALRAAADLLVVELNTIYQAMPRPITSITRAGTTATATTPTAHSLTNGMQIFVFGADVAAYNGAKTITVTGATTFTYTVAGSPATPATGTLLYALDPASPPLSRTLPQAITALKNTINAGNVD